MEVIKLRSSEHDVSSNLLGTVTSSLLDNPRLANPGRSRGVKRLFLGKFILGHPQPYRYTPIKMFEPLLQSIEISLIICIIFFYILGYRPPWWGKQAHNCGKGVRSIPGPYGIPFLGTRWVYSKLGGYSFTRVHEFYRDMFLQHGPIIKEEALWNIPIVSVVEKRDIEKVLKFSGKYPIRPPTEAIAYYRRSRPDRYASTGIVNEQGELWYNLRTSLTSDLTSTKTISSFLPQIEEIADDWCQLLKNQQTPDGNIQAIEDLASRLGLEAICALVLGRRMGFLLLAEGSDVTSRLSTAVHHHFAACRDTYYGLPLWKLLPTPAYKKLTQSEENIYNLVLELIETADDSTKESAVFQSVLNARVDPREKTAAIVDFIAAGIYTLRNSLVFLIHLISQNPEAQDRILQDDTNVYARACVSESFRLLPTANCLARITEHELDLAGHMINPGSVILCHTGLACRDDRNFRNAESFVPERWLGSDKNETANSATYLVVPFGIGRRTCPGKRFIEQVLPVVLKSTVRKFALSSFEDIQLRFEFLLAPQGPVNIGLVERN